MDLQLHRKLLSPKNYNLDEASLLSVVYHNLFGFALTEEELIRWSGRGENSSKFVNTDNVLFKGGFYFLKGNKGAVLKRILGKKFSLKKMGIAKKAALVLRKIPTIKMVGVTGSLAMKNAREDSDIDLIVVTSKGTLWTTRVVGYLLLKLLGFSLRKPRDKNEKDKLCLNMWIDEEDLAIDKQNIYTAHEIAQVVPLVNKEKTYERFIFENSWAAGYWPNAVKIKKGGKNLKRRRNYIFGFFEPVARSFQFAYMSGKITREIITPTRAFFHPFDWGEKIMREFGRGA